MRRSTSTRTLERRQFVIFSLGETDFAMDILKVNEIIKPEQITNVPQSAGFIRGIIDLRGEIIPLLDLKERLFLGKNQASDQGKVIIITLQDQLVGLLVDDVREVIWLSTGDIAENPLLVSSKASLFLQGIGKLEDRLLLIIQPDTLLTGEELEAVAGIEEKLEGEEC